MADTELLGRIFAEHGLHDYRWIDAKRIVVAEWVRFKCQWGCNNFATRAACPPHMPPVSECREFLQGYDLAAVFHSSKTVLSLEDLDEWAGPLNRLLLSAERSVFLAGYYKAFALIFQNCRMCPECAGTPGDCRNRASFRPAPDALCVDVYAAARTVGYPIAVVKDYGEQVNLYGFMLIE